MHMTIFIISSLIYIYTWVPSGKEKESLTLGKVILMRLNRLWRRPEI